MLSRSSARYIIVLYITDMLAVVVALALGRALRILLPLGRTLDAPGAALHAPMFVLAVVIWSLTLSAFKIYDPSRFAHIGDELQTTVVAIAVATLILAGALYFSYRGLSRLLYIYFFIANVGFSITARLILRWLMGSGQRMQPHGVLIIGAGQIGRRVARLLKPWTWTGIDVIGYLDDAPDKAGQVYEGVPVLGTVQQAGEIVEQRGIAEVIVALPLDAHRRVANLVTALQELPVNIKVVPDYSNLVFFRTTLEQFGGLLLIGLKEPVIGPTDRVIKRLFDLLVAGLALILLSPLLALIAAATALSSPGPVLYRSLRMADERNTFEMLKFRTMVVGADCQERDLVGETPDGRLFFDKREDDPRVTPLGRWLRRYSLDELPQLINVLKGKMSLVGPRPELPALVERYELWQRKRFGVPQGMTGWWQVSGRGNKQKYLHVEDDLYYIRHYSLFLDLQILWRTVGAVIRGDGAF
jgi:exopolysaccharide biosynthesis polyprenyl glycosylphosphotransferase